MRKIGSPLCGAIAAALIGITAVAPALAQQAQTVNIVTYDLFPPGGSVDLNPGAARRLLDAARQAQTPEECPLGRITIFVPNVGNPEALGLARRLVVLQYFDLNGIDSRRFFVDVEVLGREEGNDTLLQAFPRDGEPPRLNVTSTPEKGTKVRAGKRITVKAIANDDANRWQTGIKSIDLTAEGGGLFGFQDYSPPATTCEQPPPPRTLEGVYRVPDNPPPIVRLRAIAKDFAGNQVERSAEFPTGDWYGSLKFSSDSVVLGVKTTMTDHMDIVLNYDEQGNLTGSLVGNRSFNVQNHPDCNWTITIPNKLRGKLVGSYTPGTEVMSVQLTEPVVAPAPRKDCPGGGYIHSGGSIHEEANFQSALRSPTAAGGGRFQSDVTWMTGPVTNSISLRLQPAQAQD